jgi:hypothetical protein
MGGNSIRHFLIVRKNRGRGNRKIRQGAIRCNAERWTETRGRELSHRLHRLTQTTILLAPGGPVPQQSVKERAPCGMGKDYSKGLRCQF